MQKKRLPNRNQQRKGFTLMEVLIVMAILVILGTIVVTNFSGVLSQSKADSAKIQMQNFEQPLELYKLGVGQYPTTDTGLEALITQPPNAPDGKWRGPYLKASEIPADPWGNAYDYQAADGGFTITSSGEDGATGTDDDVTHTVSQ
ncbi:MAG: type II secretion system protein GspG [Planctomycetaceae bacterium]|nr:type II secretion system protein GspG [Planctomycetaceae bacterium]|tara:strand:+ start:1039 stop:1476 length:438 start_codon:yes stop_codon:yes gene_type:complete